MGQVLEGVSEVITDRAVLLAREKSFKSGRARRRTRVFLEVAEKIFKLLARHRGKDGLFLDRERRVVSLGIGLHAINILRYTIQITDY